MGQSTINEPFSIAMVNYQRVKQLDVHGQASFLGTFGLPLFAKLVQYVATVSARGHSSFGAMLAESLGNDGII